MRNLPGSAYRMAVISYFVVATLSVIAVKYSLVTHRDVGVNESAAVEKVELIPNANARVTADTPAIDKTTVEVESYGVIDNSNVDNSSSPAVNVNEQHNTTNTGVGGGEQPKPLPEGWVEYSSVSYEFRLGYPEEEWKLTEKLSEGKLSIELGQISDSSQFLNIYPLGKPINQTPTNHNVDTSYIGGKEVRRKLYFDEYVNGRYLYTLCQYLLYPLPGSWSTSGPGINVDASCEESDQLKAILATFTFTTTW